MTDPAITAPVSARSNDWWRRGARTLVQFIAGGGLTVLIDQFVKDIPDRYDAYVIIGAGALVALCQNYAEDAGWIPAIGKGTPSAGADPVPEPAKNWLDAEIERSLNVPPEQHGINRRKSGGTV